MEVGKTIKLYLMNGTPNGVTKCSLTNWNGLAYRVPRTSIALCKNMDVLKQTGVYFLFGTDDNDDPVVYVGQAGTRKNGEGLYGRVTEPHSSISYWDEAIMFTTTGDTLGPTEISYLENRFYNMALQTKRCKVVNGNNPYSGNVTEETRSELEQFIEYAKLVMGALGYKTLEPINSKINTSNNIPHKNINPPRLYLISGKIKAEGQCVLGGGFSVF